MKKYLDGSLRSARRIFGVHVGGHVNKQARCVGHGLRGMHFDNRKDALKALAARSRECSKES
ncbi:MAG: hypothetical protein MIO92_13565 [Methanosarcinaceae archaeon]|nr:hypothetical protein [Methanosarcinaceae archaeon]